MIQVMVPGFLASTHGFRFPNSFPPNSPVLEVPTPWGRILIGDAQYGLCGGMVYTALDCYLYRIVLPDAPTPPLFRYLCRRLLESWNFPFGVLKYYDWQCRPSASRFLAGVRVVSGVTRLMLTEEWPLIRAELDAGLPVPLGLVNVESYDPRQLARNHQVLAYGYQLDEATGEVELRVYDPNFPSDDTTTIKFQLTDPDHSCELVHSCQGPGIRGIFRAHYRKPELGPDFAESSLASDSL